MVSALEFAREGSCRLEAYRKLVILCVQSLVPRESGGSSKHTHPLLP